LADEAGQPTSRTISAALSAPEVAGRVNAMLAISDAIERRF